MVFREGSTVSGGGVSDVLFNPSYGLAIVDDSASENDPFKWTIIKPGDAYITQIDIC